MGIFDKLKKQDKPGSVMVPTKKVRKQVMVDPTLYHRIKGKMYTQGKTFSDWLEAKMQNEDSE